MIKLNRSKAHHSSFLGCVEWSPACQRETTFYWPWSFFQPSCFIDDNISTGVNSEMAFPYLLLKALMVIIPFLFRR